jgi:hypothetical protein
MGSAGFTPFVVPVAGIPNCIEQRDRKTSQRIEKVNFGVRLFVIHLVEIAEVKIPNGFGFHSFGSSPACYPIEIQSWSTLAVGGRFELQTDTGVSG